MAGSGSSRLGTSLGFTAIEMGSRFWLLLAIATALFMAPLALLPLAGAAQADAWQSVGLRGQAVYALAVTSRGGQRVIYAETVTGLWRLEQGQKGWQRVDAALPKTVLGAPALVAWRNVPGRPQQLYALTETDGDRHLYRSDDGGDTWVRIGPAPGQASRSAMLVLPGADEQDLILISTVVRAQRSTDGGASWAPGGEWPQNAENPGGRQAGPVRALYGDSSAPERLFALSENGSLWATDNGGLSWRPLAPGARVNALTIAPYFGIRLWAATQDGLLLSPDNGDSWRSLPLPAVAGSIGGQVVALRNDPRVAEVLYIALKSGMIYVTADNGVSWVALGTPGTAHIAALAIDQDTRDVLFAATDDGIWARKLVPFQPTPVPTFTATVPFPTETPTHTPSPTRTSTPTATLTPTPSPSWTPSPTATAIQTATWTPTRRPAPTRTPTTTATLTPSVIPTQPWLPVLSPEAAPSQPGPGPTEAPPVPNLPTPTPVPTIQGPR